MINENQLPNIIKKGNRMNELNEKKQQAENEMDERAPPSQSVYGVP